MRRLPGIAWAAGLRLTVPSTNLRATSVGLNTVYDQTRGGTHAKRRLALVALAACILAAWMLEHPFAGIYHDSVLYTFQALARLHPEPLAHDIFLRFGSQDQYTIFSPLYAAAIRLLGVEPAAAILTFLCHVLFFCSAWLLARQFMARELALVAVGLLVALPSGYGADYIFNYIEEFLTPRQPSEAFALAGLAAALAGRNGWAFASMAIGALLHPIIGVAGVVLLLSLRVAIPKPQLATGIACVGFSLLAGTAYLMPTGPFSRMDDTWLHLIGQRSQFLFVLRWSADDWARALTPLGVLAVGAVAAVEVPIRRFCLAALITAAAGVALCVLGGDLLRIVIVLQAQTWRWLWIANVSAVLLLPAICRDCWRLSTPGRTAALLLVAVWVARGQSLALCSLLLVAAFSAAVTARRGIRFRQDRMVLAGAGAAVVILLLTSLASKFQLLQLTSTAFDSPLPIQLQLARQWSHDGILPVTLIVGGWLAGRRWNTAYAHGAMLIAGAAACSLLLPSAWSAWTQRKYPPEMSEAYASFRAQIPVHAEVLWPEAYVPFGVWYLLGRQSYLSPAQTAGLVFSRTAALAMYERAKRVDALVGPWQFEDWIPFTDAHLTRAQSLKKACAAGSDLGYVVTSQDLGSPELASYTPDQHHPNVRTRLYRCADIGVSP